MSNILIIKHGSLGDIAQISGAIRDIRENYKNEKIFILTTAAYKMLLNKCPYLDGVIIDKRLPRWNIFYLMDLKKTIKKYEFSKVFDLQNSSRTSFYKKYLFQIQNWSSTDATLKEGTSKSNFDNDPVLERFKFQLDNSNIKTKYVLQPDFSWACTDIDQIVNKFTKKKLLIIFPFCSPKHKHKQWPYFNKLIKIIKLGHENIEIIIAPDKYEIKNSKSIDALTIINKNEPLNIMEVSGLIKKASFVISNDTGPAHIAAHLGKKGLVLFGHHTTPEKVSIETENFKSLKVNDLKNLTAEQVYFCIKDKLEKIFN